MANHQATASFREHLETLVRSTSAGALCDTDEEALRALEKKYGITPDSYDPTDEDVEQYLQSQWQSLGDDVHDEADHDNEDTQEPESLQWLRQ